MIQIRKSAILAMAALATAAMAVQDGMLLRRSFAEGQTETYVVETTTKQTVNLPNGMGEQEMASTVGMTYKIKTGKFDADKKSAPVEMTYTIDKFDAEGMMGQAGGDMKGKSTTTKGTIDERGRIIVAPEKTTNAMAAMMSGAQSLGASSITVELPEKAVKVGDTWEVLVPKSPFTGKEDQKLTAKLVGEKDVDGKAAWVVSTEGVIKTDADLSEMTKDAPGPMQGQKMTVKGTMEVKSDGVVEKSSGRTLRLTTKMNTKQTVEMPDMGFTIGTNGTITTVVTAK